MSGDGFGRTHRNVRRGRNEKQESRRVANPLAETESSREVDQLRLNRLQLQKEEGYVRVKAATMV